jgi:integrase
LPFGATDHFSARARASGAIPTAFVTGSSLALLSGQITTGRGPGCRGCRDITPHSLRRTWATFAATIGRDPKWIAAQIGHVSPAFTFSVYQQVATRRYADEEGCLGADAVR